jgi:hypothetical protein
LDEGIFNGLKRRYVRYSWQKAEGRRRKAEGGRQKAEGGRQKAEGRRRKAEGGRQKAEGRRIKKKINHNSIFLVNFIWNNYCLI